MADQAKRPTPRRAPKRRTVKKEGTTAKAAAPSSAASSSGRSASAGASGLTGGVRMKSSSSKAPKQAKKPSVASKTAKASKPAKASAPAKASKVGLTSKTAKVSAAGTPSLGAPALWTKDGSKASATGRAGDVAGNVAGGVLGAIVAFFSLIGRGIAMAFGALASLVKQSKAALVAVIVVAVLLVGGVTDTALNWGKIYPGVKVGEVDLSGATLEEAQAAIDATYSQRLVQASAVIYASDEARRAAEAGHGVQGGPAEQQSVEEQQQAMQQWTVASAELGATLPSSELAAEALAVGRDDGGVLSRMLALMFGHELTPRAAYEETLFEAFAQGIDATIGVPRVDYGIVVEEGSARVTDGADGSLVDRVEFASELNRAFLENADNAGAFVAYARYAPVRIDQSAAQAVADKVNAALADGAVFTYEGTSWQATPSMVGAWVATRIDPAGEGYQLVPYVNSGAAKADILTRIRENGSAAPLQVSFEVSGDSIAVHTDASGTIPLTAEAVAALDTALFGSADAATHQGAQAADGTPVEVTVASTAAPESMTLEAALEAGVVSAFSEYTTEYTTGSGTEGRNHNIHLVSDLLNNSVAKANGGTWSFNGTTGECNADKGFQAAGAIIDGQYTDSIGGGICQVATTVFNAVYEAGYPVPKRYNHSLYIASYPTGRDAAVSWGDLDLQWTNDGASDVLMQLSYTVSSVTVTLYGVDPGYQVSSEIGEWQPGEEYSTRYIIDDSMSPTASYVKTSGTNGRSVTVIRTVTDKAGTVLHKDTFRSNYDPKNEVKIIGPGEEADAAKAKGLVITAS